VRSAEILFWSAWAAIAYTYAGFPILLALFARLFGRGVREPEQQAEDALPRVAMVVAAYNEAQWLPAKLANTWALDYPADKFQLLVGSDGSSDGTNAILAGCADARLRARLFESRRGKISVLNDLAAGAEADILVMSDANTAYAPDAIRKLVRHFQDPAVGCVSGELKLAQDGGVSGEGLYWRYEGWIKRCESRLGFLIGCNGGIYALRTGLYEPLPASTIVDDFVLTVRIVQRGFRVRFDPDARATEPACPSAHAEMIRKIRIGAGGFQALSLTSRLLLPGYGMRAFAYWGHKVLRWLAPLFLLLEAGANAALIGNPVYGALLAAQLAGIAIAVWSYRMPSEQGAPRWIRPISYFYIMNYALLCGLLKYLAGRQRVTWDRASR
jgi:cellulose synthase/poly-beta-1,6-N-acetylglucosamine synthase-like glycosyltransferase